MGSIPIRVATPTTAIRRPSLAVNTICVRERLRAGISACAEGSSRKVVHLCGY